MVRVFLGQNMSATYVCYKCLFQISEVLVSVGCILGRAQNLKKPGFLGGLVQRELVQAAQVGHQ